MKRKRTPRSTALPAAPPVHPAVDELDDWMTQADYVARYPQFASLSAVRWAVANRERNGLAAADAVRLVGKRILVHRVRFTRVRLGELPKSVRHARAVEQPAAD